MLNMAKETRVRELPNCDICRAEGHQAAALYDAAIPGGPWANLCQVHFEALGCQLGTGRGQKLVVTAPDPVQEVFKPSMPRGINVADMIEQIKEKAVDGQHREMFGGVVVVDIFVTELSPVDVLLLEALSALAE